MNDIRINAPEGRIEASYYHSPIPDSPIAMVMHHHPEHGGNMNNKAVYTIYKAFVDLGFSVLRFNFRGVGKSEGRFSDGESEIMDAAYVLIGYNHIALVKEVVGLQDFLLAHGLQCNF